MCPFEIDGVPVGRDERPYVLAEVGINHEGDIDLAIRMIRAASEAGADGVKFQTFRADTLVNREKEPEQWELFSKLELSDEDHLRLLSAAVDSGIAFISTPFGEEEADFLNSIGVPAIKIASGDMTNFPLLAKVGSFGIPVILSTGMSYMDEVSGSRQVLLNAGCRDFALLHCVSRYPTTPEEANLNSIVTMLNEFPEVVGFSDHTEGIWAAPAAVALGATFIEKHFTLDRTLPGPDHALSVEPGELKILVDSVRKVFDGLGSGIKEPCPEELKNRHRGRKGIYASHDLDEGTVLKREDLRISRPEGSIAAGRTGRVIGMKLARPVIAGSELVWEDFGPDRGTHQKSL